MVGTRGKGSKSKSKGLASGDSLNNSLNESADGPLDGVKGGDDSSNVNLIPSVEEHLEDSDGHKEQEHNEHVGSDMEKDVVTETNEINVDGAENVCTRKGTKEEEGDGIGSSANLTVEDNEEKPEEDEVPVKFGLGNSDPCTAEELKSSEVTAEGLPTNNEDLDALNHGIVDNITNILENYEEPSNLNADEPISTLSDRDDEEPVKENGSLINEVTEVPGQVSRPKRKVISKRLVKKKMVRRKGAAVHENLPLPLDENNAIDEACKVNTNEVTITNDKDMSNVNFASDEACKADPKEHANNEGKAEVKPPVKVTKKVSRGKKKKAPQGYSGVPQGHSGVATAKDDQKLPTEDIEPGSKEHVGIGESDAKNEVGEKSGVRVSLLNKSKKKKAAKKALLEEDAEAANKPNSSKEGKQSKRMDSMGMVFMCSSETKKDCYRYKVLGLPAGKKDMVLKIYKGMRLFLFDVELRMMYGIYKAADPGGYNIEPRAFKSQYPSQVRFVTLEDCVPLAEERFKQVLKENYYTKNKFNCQLNSKQVRNLCKLFHETSKKAKPIKVNGKNQKAAATSSAAWRDKKRKRVEDSRGGASTAPGQERSRGRAQEGSRHAPVVIDDRYRERPVYKRETFMPSVAPVPLYQPLTPSSLQRSRAYSYDRDAGVDPYRREPILDHDLYRREIPVLDRDSYRREIPAIVNDSYRSSVLNHNLYRRESAVDRRDVVLSSSRESRVPIEHSHHEPYASYREVREPRFYNGPAYSTDPNREHDDYSSSRRYAEYYRPAAEDRPAPPLYRRY